MSNAQFKQSYLTAGLSDEEIQDLFSIAEVRRHVSGDAITTFGKIENELIVVLEGRVNILTEDGDKLAEVGPGSVIGEIELLDARPRTANAVCVGLVDIAVFPSLKLRAKLNANRHVGFVVLANLGRVLCMRLRDADVRIDTLSDTARGGAWNSAL